MGVLKALLSSCFGMYNSLPLNAVILLCSSLVNSNYSSGLSAMTCRNGSKIPAWERCGGSKRWEGILGMGFLECRRCST